MRPMPASGIQLYRILIGLKNKQHSFCMLHGPVVNWIQHSTELHYVQGSSVEKIMAKRTNFL